MTKVLVFLQFLSFLSLFERYWAFVSNTCSHHLAVRTTNQQFTYSYSNSRSYEVVAKAQGKLDDQDEDVKARYSNMGHKSKRTRKRPLSIVNAVNENLVYETKVRPLEMDGKLIEANYKFLRTIKPYAYTYTTYAKGRWEGRTILDVYSTEYGAYPNSYYVTAISQGRILVSDTKVSTSYIIKGGDILSHTVHRHEPGVAVQSDVEPYVTVVEETDELLIVDKPGTMAVHPCGGYNMQSLVNILIEHYTSPLTGGKIEKLYPVHRLDRLTSGLIILGKNSSVAQTLGKCIMNRGCQKIYLARVKGKFPLKYRNLKILNQKQYTQTGIPLHGEWDTIADDEDETSNKDKQQMASARLKGTLTSNDISRLRKQHAQACWIEDEQGNPVFEDADENHNDILEQVFQRRHRYDIFASSSCLMLLFYYYRYRYRA